MYCKKKDFARFLSGMILTAAAVMIAGCGEPEIESNWLNREISVDGIDDEWGGLGVYDDEDKGSRISVTNDGKEIFLCLSTSDPRTQIQVLKNGLTVWFDRGGGDEKHFGIHYPMRPLTEEPVVAGMDSPAGKGRRSGNRGESGGIPAPDPRLIRLLLDEIPGALEIIGPERDTRLTRRVEEALHLGIEASIDMRGDRLVYELKVPLALPPGSVYAIGSVPGTVLGVGFVAGTGLRPGGGPPGGMSPSAGMGGRGTGGGRGGPGGRGGMGGRGNSPGGKGGRGGGMKTPPGPLEAWIKLRLATEI